MTDQSIKKILLQFLALLHHVDVRSDLYTQAFENSSRNYYFFVIL